jgi:dolichol kinase
MSDWLAAAIGVVSVAYGLWVLIAPGSLVAVLTLVEQEADRNGYRLNFARLFMWPLLRRVRRIGWGLWLLMYGGLLVWGALSNPPKEAVQASEILLVVLGVVASVVIWRWVVSELNVRVEHERRPRV